jgi:hypothetical protein
MFFLLWSLLAMPMAQATGFNTMATASPCQVRLKPVQGSQALFYFVQPNAR